MFVMHSRRSAKKRQSASAHDTQENTSSWWWWQHTLFLNLIILCYVWTQNNGFLWDILGFSFCKLVTIKKIKAMLLVFIKIIDMAMLGGGRFWDNALFFYGKQCNMSLNLLWWSMHGVGSLTSKYPMPKRSPFNTCLMHKSILILTSSLYIKSR